MRSLFLHCIYCSTHPDRFQELLKHMHSVQLGAKCIPGLGWKSYDEQFRLRKAQDPASSWATIDTELWLLFMQSTQPRITQSDNPVSKLQSLKCYAYNYDNHCTEFSCDYQHTWLRCGRIHSVNLCTINLISAGFNNTSTGSQF